MTMLISVKSTVQQLITSLLTLGLYDAKRPDSGDWSNGLGNMEAHHCVMI